MGEIADATINGDFCEGCGEWLGEGDGFPRLCAGCGGDDFERGFQDLPAMRYSCPICRKLFRSAYAMNQHRRDAHQDGPEMRYPCPHCKVVKKSQQGIGDHIKAKHPEQAQRISTDPDSSEYA